MALVISAEKTLAIDREGVSSRNSRCFRGVKQQ